MRIGRQRGGGMGDGGLCRGWGLSVIGRGLVAGQKSGRWEVAWRPAGWVGCSDGAVGPRRLTMVALVVHLVAVVAAISQGPGRTTACVLCRHASWPSRSSTATTRFFFHCACSSEGIRAVPVVLAFRTARVSNTSGNPLPNAGF